MSLHKSLCSYHLFEKHPIKNKHPLIRTNTTRKHYKSCSVVDNQPSCHPERSSPLLQEAMEGRAKFVFYLLVASLAFSELVRSNAVPVTRTGNLMMQETRVREHIPARTSSVISGKGNSGGEAGDGRRMDIELNDYPGSGANNRHTPRPLSGRGCVEC